MRKVRLGVGEQGNSRETAGKQQWLREQGMSKPTEREIIQTALELLELQGHVVKVRDRAGNVVTRGGEVLWELTDTGKQAALSEMLEEEEGVGGVH